MREEQLSPQLGRLIDAVKRGLPPDAAEAVAVLTAGGAIFCARCPAGAAERCGGVARALRAARDAGETKIVAAAVACADSSAPDVLPCARCRRALAALDPELPVVLKRRGRWVLRELSSLPLAEEAAEGPGAALPRGEN